jgi:CRP-like cAMP-binding protein
MRADPDYVAPVERVLALRACRSFDTLTPAELAQIAGHLRTRRFSKGAELVRPGVPRSAMQFIVRGHVQVSRGGETARRVGPHETIGDLAELFRDEPAPRVVAVEETLALELDRADIEDLLEDEFPIFLGVLRGMARELSHAPSAVFHAVEAPYEKPLRGVAPREASPLGWVERILVLRRTLDFADAEVDALGELARQATELVVASGTRLWVEGDPSNYFLVLITGHVSARTGRERFEFGPGSAVGALDSLSSDARWFSATAEDHVRALRIPAHSLLELMEDNLGLGINLLRAVARGIGETDAVAT